MCNKLPAACEKLHSASSRSVDSSEATAFPPRGDLKSGEEWGLVKGDFDESQNKLII